MRIALINPPWSFAGSILFRCREPHLPAGTRQVSVCSVMPVTRRMFDCHLNGHVNRGASQRGQRVPAGHDGCHDRADVPVLRARLLNYACRG